MRGLREAFNYVKPVLDELKRQFDEALTERTLLEPLLIDLRTRPLHDDTGPIEVVTERTMFKPRPTQEELQQQAGARHALETAEYDARLALEPILLLTPELLKAQTELLKKGFCERSVTYFLYVAEHQALILKAVDSARAVIAKEETQAHTKLMQAHRRETGFDAQRLVIAQTLFGAAQTEADKIAREAAEAFADLQQMEHDDRTVAHANEFDLA